MILKIKDCRVFMKVCSDCGQLKLIRRFSKRGEGERRKQCTSCERKRKKKYNRVCKNCGQEFLGLKNQEYCCKKCKDNSQLDQIEFTCDYCGKLSSHKRGVYESNKYNFCSKECAKSFRDPSKHHIVNCNYCGAELDITDCEFNKSEHHFCNRECQANWQRETWRGENHPNWKPELSQEERELNNFRQGMAQWRTNIYERDNYTCQCCGTQGGWGVRLNAHHISGWNIDKENRTNVDNGVTLCEDCHNLFHKLYGYGNNTKEQFEEFMRNSSLPMELRVIKQPKKCNSRSGKNNSRAKSIYCIELNKMWLCCKECYEELNIGLAYTTFMAQIKQKGECSGYHFHYMTKEEVEEYLKLNKDLEESA